ncbi:FG-GAP-like repeat-containing protein [Agromyces sp. NPDC057865]|uniref:FG-GAP-like repeat-containing protein n=1 Tax=Agromyces sp. NPDC057865 TaxID=3346267 RepID=UPI0036708D7C
MDPSARRSRTTPAARDPRRARSVGFVLGFGLAATALVIPSVVVDAAFASEVGAGELMTSAAAGQASTAADADPSLRATGTRDFDGDRVGDVFRVTEDGRLLLYRGDARGGWVSGEGAVVGSGWDVFAGIVAPGDFDGDGNADLVGVGPDGSLRLYAGDGDSGWIDGRGAAIHGAPEPQRVVLAPGDFSGDGIADLIGVGADGILRLYVGDGAGGVREGVGIGSGWDRFPHVFTSGDFTGDTRPDVLAVTPEGAFMIYPGDGRGGWLNEYGFARGSGWDMFAVLTSPGDFTADTKPDVLGVTPDGSMLLYRGNGVGAWVTGIGELIGAGW